MRTSTEPLGHLPFGFALRCALLLGGTLFGLHATAAKPAIIPPAPFIVPTPASPRPPIRAAHVAVYGEGRLLWAGDLRFGGAEFGGHMESTQQAPAPGCTSEAHRKMRYEESMYVNINAPFFPPGSKTRVTYQVNWKRPGDCHTTVVERSVHLEGQIDPGPELVTVRGDSGLVLKLQMRP